MFLIMPPTCFANLSPHANLERPFAPSHFLLHIHSALQAIAPPHVSGHEQTAFNRWLHTLRWSPAWWPPRPVWAAAQAEKAELAALKDGAEEVDADAESRARLAALRGAVAPAQAKASGRVPVRTAQVQPAIPYHLAAYSTLLPHSLPYSSTFQFHL